MDINEYAALSARTREYLHEQLTEAADRARRKLAEVEIMDATLSARELLPDAAFIVFDSVEHGTELELVRIVSVSGAKLDLDEDLADEFSDMVMQSLQAAQDAVGNTLFTPYSNTVRRYRLMLG